MRKIILSTGRGGTGKTTFTALVSRYLERPLLLIDIDPDQSLADMLGVDLEQVKITTDIGRELPIRTASDIAQDIEEGALTEMGGGPVTKKLQFLTETYSMYRSEKFDLVSLGPRWTEGDYRLANLFVEVAIFSTRGISPLGVKYTHIIVDSPAGLEHLNRKVVPDIDDMFLILDPSKKSIKHLGRVKKITKEVGINYKHLYLVGNYEFDDETEKYLQDTGETYLGKIDYDASVRDYNLRGKSLLELPEDSPACLSIRKILAKAGYPTG